MKHIFKNPIYTALLVVIAVLIIDQVSKILIKTTMVIGEEFPVFGDWFWIHFTENKGMAFGLSFGGIIGKYALTFLRIFFVIGICWFLNKLIKKHQAPRGVVIGVSLIIAGALGNIIDSIFYGVLFSHSFGQIAQFLPDVGAAPLFQGHVVDMLYFPIIDTHFPDWVPFWGGDHLLFFRPIFNIADTAITCGLLYIVLFQRKYFAEIDKP